MTKLDYAHPTLRREIGLFGAVMLGLGSILGTGVFVSLAHATELAGPWVLLAIVLAGLLAYCNAMSSAQLAAAYPVSGGTYEYGYRVLNPTLGFTAGWMFLLAKSASAATAALGVMTILIDQIVEHPLNFHIGRFEVHSLADVLLVQTPFGNRATELSTNYALRVGVGLSLVVGFTCANLFGVRKAGLPNLFCVAVTLFGLLAVIVAYAGPIDWVHQAWGTKPSATFRANEILGACALIFVAFTGYARIATLGEEVRRAEIVIPRAIIVTLAVTSTIYILLGWITVRARDWWPWDELNVVALAGHMPYGWRYLHPIASLAAVTAMLGVLLNLILGLSRVWLAMGRRGDMPRVLARVNEKTSTPVPATILSGLVIALLVLVGDVRTTWSFSAFTVLIYYALTNLACLRLAPQHRRYPRALAWVGLFTCLSLAWFVEMKVWIAGTILIVVGLVWHRIRSRWRIATNTVS